MLFDTCNSGSFLSQPGSRGIAEKTAVDCLVKGVGRTMIVASASDQVALEGYVTIKVLPTYVEKRFAFLAQATPRFEKQSLNWWVTVLHEID